MKGSNILLVSENGWVLPEIWDTPIFCPYMVFSGGVMTLVVVSFSMEMYYNDYNVSGGYLQVNVIAILVLANSGSFLVSP